MTQLPIGMNMIDDDVLGRQIVSTTLIELKRKRRMKA